METLKAAIPKLQKIHEKFENVKSASWKKGPRYYKISFYSEYLHTFNELAIKNILVQKIRPLFVFMEWLHLPHG